MPDKNQSCQTCANYVRDSSMSPPPLQTLLEQHVGTILQVMVAALLAWSLQTTIALGNDVSVLKVQLTSLMDSVRTGTNDRYRATEAMKDFSRIDTEIRRLDSRIGSVEGKGR